MRVVSENSAEDLARFDAERRAELALRQLAANLIRVVRGAGRPYEIAKDAASLLEAWQAHWDAVGHYPASDFVAATLDVNDRRLPSAFGDDADRHYAIETMMRGGLQLAASRLLDQTTQKRAGESEIIDGARDYSAWQEERRKAWEKANASAHPVTPRKRPKRK